MGTHPTTVQTNQNLDANFFESIYRALFEPLAFYELIANTWPRTMLHLLYAALIVVVVSSTGVFLLNTNQPDLALTAWQVVSAFSAGTFGIVSWLLTAVTFSIISYSFRSQGRLGTLLTLMGYAMLPWIFTAPLAMIRFSLGMFGLVIYFLGLVILWFWTTILFLAAIQKTYSLTMDRVLLISIIPLLISTLGFVWMLGGLSTIFTLFG